MSEAGKNDVDEAIGSARVIVTRARGGSRRRRSRDSEVAPTATADTDGWFERGIFLALIAGLAWAPFWLGGNRLFPWAFNAVWFGGLVCLYEIGILWPGKRHPVGLKELAIPIALFAGVVAWIFLQLSTWVPVTLHHPIWASASEMLDLQLPGSISVDRDLTALALLRLLTSACVLWLSIQLCRDPARAHFLLQAVGVIGVVYALYAFLAPVLFSSAIFWFDAPAGGLLLRSTFVNRNNFATWIGLTFIASLGLLMRMYFHERARLSGSWRQSVVEFIEVAGNRGALLVGACALTFVALLLTGSRGGILSTAFATFILVIVSFDRGKRNAIQKLETIAFVSAGLAICFILFGDVFVGRINASGVFDTNRWSVYMISLQSILDAPVLGLGYGAFQSVFPMYRDRSISPLGFWDKAHNTYVEIFQGLGLLAGAMLVGAVGFLAYKCFRGATIRTQSATPCCVGLAATALVGAHALVDFSLQIQAITLTFMSLLGAGVAQSVSSRRLVAD